MELSALVYCLIATFETPILMRVPTGISNVLVCSMSSSIIRTSTPLEVWITRRNQRVPTPSKCTCVFADTLALIPGFPATLRLAKLVPSVLVVTAPPVVLAAVTA